MDVQMPIMDGYEATRRIRKLAKGSKIPIIGMTANVFEKDRLKCISSGMNDFIPKPLEIKQFLKTVSLWVDSAVNARDKFPKQAITKSKAKAENSGTKSGTGSNNRPDGLQDDQQDNILQKVNHLEKTEGIQQENLKNILQNNLQKTSKNHRQGDRQNSNHYDQYSDGQNAQSIPIDFEAYIKRMGGNSDIAISIIKGFIECIPSQLQNIDAAVNSNDIETVDREAHSIKGGALNVFANDLMQAARELEMHAKSGSLQHAPGLLKNIRKEYERLLKFSTDYIS
jgi:CheY-like chemotaxis protein